MRCSRVKKYNSRVAIDKERTRHDGCTGWNFRNLCEVYASCLNGSFLLLVGLIGVVSLRRLWCRIDVSGLWAVAGEVAWLAVVETGVLGKQGLRRSRSSSIPLLRRWLIILRPLDILLLSWPNSHLLLPLGLESRPRRCLISHPGTLGSIS